MRSLPLVDRQVTLLTAPIPLPKSRIGLLVRGPESAEFKWLVWDLKAPTRNDADVATKINDAPATAIRGDDCQRDILESRIIAFSTRLGHWVWDLARAGAGEVTAIKDTWPRPPSAKYSIPMGQRWQAISMQWDEDRTELVGFDWYFQAAQGDGGGGINQTYYYTVKLNGLVPNDHTVLMPTKEAVPFGVRPNPAGTPKVLFRVGDGLYLGDGQSQRYVQFPGVLDPRVVTCQLHGPLVLMQGEQAASSLRFFRLFSLTDQTAKAETFLKHEEDLEGADLKLNRIRSQPLLWSRWLFTVEEHNGILGVRRREILSEATH